MGKNKNSSVSKKEVTSVTGYHWSPHSLLWCADLKLKDLFFLDNNLNLSQRSIQRVYPHSKVLLFPKEYSGLEDPELLTEVLKFIKGNSILIENRVKFHFVTYDVDFTEDSNASTLLIRSRFRIHFEILDQPDMIVDQLNLIAEGNKRWVRYIKLPT